MLEHARSHLALYRAIVGRDTGGIVTRKIHGIIADLVDADLKSLGITRGADQRALAMWVRVRRIHGSSDLVAGRRSQTCASGGR